MARLALSPVPSNGLVVLLLLLSGTAPPLGLLPSLPATLFPPPLSLLSPPSSCFTLSAFRLGLPLLPWGSAMNSGVCAPPSPAPGCIIRLS